MKSLSLYLGSFEFSAGNFNNQAVTGLGCRADVMDDAAQVKLDVK